MHPEKRQSDGLLDFGSEAIISLIPVSKAIALAAICLAGGLALVSLIIVITRLWARMRWAKTNGADWSILFANMLFTGQAVFIIIPHTELYNQNGSVSVPTITRITNDLMIEEVLYTWTVMILKISVAFSLWRHFTSRWQRLPLFCFVALGFLLGLVHFFLTVFQCGVPTIGGSLWQHKATNGCYSNRIRLGIAYPQSTVNAFTNVIFCISGWYLIWRGSVPRGLKLPSYAILLIAIIGTAASIARLVYLNRILVNGLNMWVQGQPFLIISVVEPGLWIVAASLAALSPLTDRNRRSMQSHHSNEKHRPDSEDRILVRLDLDYNSETNLNLDDDHTLVSARNSRNTTHLKYNPMEDKKLHHNSRFQEGDFNSLFGPKRYSHPANYPHKIYQRNDTNDSGWAIDSQPPQLSIPEGLAAPFSDRFSRSSWWNLSNMGRQSNRQSMLSHDDSITSQIGEFPQPSRTLEGYRRWSIPRR